MDRPSLAKQALGLNQSTKCSRMFWNILFTAGHHSVLPCAALVQTMARLRSVHVAAAAALLLLALARCAACACTPARRWTGGVRARRGRETRPPEQQWLTFRVPTDAAAARGERHRAAAAYTIVIPAGESRCFFEDLEKDTKMGIQFEVGTGGHLDIDFEVRGRASAAPCPALREAPLTAHGRLRVLRWLVPAPGTQLTDPNKRVLFMGVRQNSETYTFAAEQAGRYEYCFKNGMSTVTEKTVSFDVIVDSNRGTAGPTPSRSAEDIALDAEVAELMHNLRSVRDNQQYQRLRERAHRNSTPPHCAAAAAPRGRGFWTAANVAMRRMPWAAGAVLRRPAAESTNTRVQWYSIFQVVLLLAVAIFQLWYLRRFFEVKQVI